MIEALFLLISFLKSGLKNQTELALENLALRQQLAILKRNRPHARLRRRDRLFWACLSALWQRWRESLIVVKAESVVRWHRRGFTLYWIVPKSGSRLKNIDLLDSIIEFQDFLMLCYPW